MKGKLARVGLNELLDAASISKASDRISLPLGDNHTTTSETIEFLKWAVGLPAVLITTITIPYIIRKHHLECRKLRLEIRRLHKELGDELPEGYYTTPGPTLVWVARNWHKTAPLYGYVFPTVLVLSLIFLRASIALYVIMAIIWILQISILVIGQISEDAYDNFVWRKFGLKPLKSIP